MQELQGLGAEVGWGPGAMTRREPGTGRDGKLQEEEEAMG